ncbi:MAG: hypothetical protein ABH834_06265, partial [Candidatus Altiarchaeota archaeon]
GTRLTPLVGVAILFAGLLLYSYPESGRPTAIERVLVTVMLVLLSLMWGAGHQVIKRRRARYLTMIFAIYLILVPTLLFAGYRSLQIVEDNPILDHKYCGTFQLEMSIENYREFENLTGFDEEKGKIRDFINDYLTYLEENTSCYSARPDGFSPPLPEHIR